MKDEIMPHTEVEQFLKNALCYVLENRDPDLDYSKYISPEFIITIDGKTFNFEQWVTHFKNIKKITTSITPVFHSIIAKGTNVAASYHVISKKPDGDEEICVKILAFFEIKDQKIVRCDELTHMLEGNQEDRNIASLS